MRFLGAFVRFWYELIIGDDWKIAAAVAGTLLLGAVAVVVGAGDSALLAPLLALGISAAFTISMLVDTRPRGGRR